LPGAWVVGLSVVGAIMLFIASGNAASSTDGPATWVNGKSLGAGLAFSGLNPKNLAIGGFSV